MMTTRGQSKSSAVRKSGQTLVPRCEVATSFFARFLGLMGRPSLPADQGLYFPRCNSIHTFFMRFPIDVVYLDGDSRVVDVDRALKPWRMGKPRWKAKHVLELASGRAADLGIAVGDRLEVTA
jgi:uncharacterized membrane protein (UPF0127 family)